MLLKNDWYSGIYMIINALNNRCGKSKQLNQQWSTLVFKKIETFENRLMRIKPGQVFWIESNIPEGGFVLEEITTISQMHNVLSDWISDGYADPGYRLQGEASWPWRS